MKYLVVVLLALILAVSLSCEKAVKTSEDQVQETLKFYKDTGVSDSLLAELEIALRDTSNDFSTKTTETIGR